MKAYALMTETFQRKTGIRIVHLAWLAAYPLMFLIPFSPDTRWQWGGFLFAWSGCFLPVSLSAGIFGDDIASGRMRMVMTEPIRPFELYLYRFLGLSLQAAAHLLSAGAVILLLHQLTNRGRTDHFAAWLLASWLIFNTWTALSASLSVVVGRQHNSMLVVLGALVAAFPLYMLLLFFEDHLGTRIYLGILRYAGPPIELLVRFGRGRDNLLQATGTIGHSLLLTGFYGAVGIVLLARREFKGATD